jgi:hypothetical protein
MMQKLNMREKQPRVIKLPCVENSASKVILDPLSINVAYKLPSVSHKVLEKFTPAALNIVPIEDPAPHPGVCIEKQAMPWILKIRHKKMKRHKLIKFRKRMVFQRRKMFLLKQQKKEAAMIAYEKKMDQWATEFNPEEYISSRISQARKGGWGIDVVKSWHDGRAK